MMPVSLGGPAPKWLTAPLLILVIALSGCSSGTSGGPLVAEDQAHTQLEALFDDTAGSLNPKVEWIKGWYDIYPDYTGFCGTQGCTKTGRAEMAGNRWIRTRISAIKQPEFVDQVSKFWESRGFAVKRNGLELEIRASNQLVQLRNPAQGCVEMHSSLTNVVDTSNPDGSGVNPYGQKPNADGGKSCGTLNDPYWSG